MKKPSLSRMITSVFCALLGLQSAMAELPSLTDKESFGCFAISTQNKYTFRIETRGRFELLPDGGRKKTIHESSSVVIEPVIEEVMPDGTFTTRSINYSSLESSDTPTAELEKTTIRGKANGDISFEMSAEIRQRTLLYGGKIISPGPKIKNPLRFSVRIKIPSLYQKTQVKGPKQEEKFQKTLEDDRIFITHIDGEKLKENFAKSIDASSEEINGPGIASVEIDSAAYGGKKVAITAAPNSSLKMSNSSKEPLHKGFSLMWTTDAAQDKNQQVQIAIEVR